MTNRFYIPKESRWDPLSGFHRYHVIDRETGATVFSPRTFAAAKFERDRLNRQEPLKGDNDA